MAARAIGALLFVVLLALFVAQPVLFSDGERSGPAPTVAPSITPSESPGEPSERKTVRRLVHGYPRACLRAAPVPVGDGLIAALDRRQVTITTIAGEVRGTINDVAPTVRSPIAWSPSGRVLALGPQGLFWTSNGDRIPIGDVQHGMVVGARGRWAWSPIADCGIHIDEQGALLITAVNPNTSTPGRLAVGAGIPLVRPPVESFSFSPDGQRLGIVMRETGLRSPASFWIADLRLSRMEEMARFPSATCCITLGGWSPDGDELLFWAASGVSVSADGWPLSSIDPESGRMTTLATLRVRPGFLEPCGEDLMGIVGGDRFDVGPMQLAELRPSAKPRVITPKTESHFYLSCSSNAALIATARGRVVDASAAVRSTPRTELVILRADGSEVTTLTPAGMSDVAPEWGPQGAGLIFVRLSDDDVSVWFAPEGETPTPLGVSVSMPRPDFAWQRVLDWSATPPHGLPAG